jgi:hypothetical protein
MTNTGGSGMIDDEPTIEPGWVAYGSDGERIGEVDDVAPTTFS